MRRLALLLVGLLGADKSMAAAPAGHAMVVSVQHDASDAGLAVLRQGGNAVDAAVAVGFALAVTYPRAGNIGGGGFMLLRGGDGVAKSSKTGTAKLPAGETHFVDFRERAPRAATREMYLDAKGDVVPGLSTLGYKAIGVPGTVAGLVYAQRHWGRLTLKQDMAAAIAFARDGFVLSEWEAGSLHSTNLVKFPESRRIFQRDGNFYKGGETLRQPELARTLERIAADPEDFYRGKLAAEFAGAVSSHGGLITAADMAAYQPVDRKALVGEYTAQGVRYEVITAPPPSSGGVALIEILNMLSGLDLTGAGGDRSPGQMHLIVEAFRRAYMDRQDYLGDPDYNALPIAAMMSAEYAAAWRRGIDPVKPTPSAELKRPAGFLPTPPGTVGVQKKESLETTQYSIVDADGTAVSVTYTLNGLFGCGATADGLGIVLNNEMDDFTSKPGVPNMFKVLQSEANAIAPGHRPLSSMTPTIVLRAGGRDGKEKKLALVLGSPGGSTIPTTVTNDLLSIVVNGLSVQASADAPRFHHQYMPDVLQFEKAFPHDGVEAMRAMGYVVSQSNEADTKIPGVWGGSEMIWVDEKTGELQGATDPRYPPGKVAQY